MKKIIITGAVGRLGYRFSQKLKASYEIIGIDNQKKENLPFDYYLMDLSSDQSMKEGFERIFQKHGKEFHTVIHLAAYYSFQDKAFEPYQKITIEGTKRLLHELEQAQVDQFIFSSTLLVYAPCKMGEKIKEDSPLLAKWAYPQSKIETEEVIFSRKQEFPAVILRIAGCYDDQCHSIPLAHHIQRIYEKSLESHFYPGSFQSGAPFLHFDDLIDVVEKVIDKRVQLAKNEIFILAEEKTLTHQDLQEKLGILIWQKPWKTYPIPKWLAKLGSWLQQHTPFMPKPFIHPWMIDLTDDYCAIDLSKSKALLDWEPKHSLEQTLPIMVQELKNDPQKWYQENNLN